ncbi:hypothetical protein DRP04_05850 [Archaeoglobales archaeon]|nr:MAG: hypothetical protein DRP04_05850 [Archaeoglobales archaeon]
MTSYDALFETCEGLKAALKDLLENADLTKSQRKKIEDLLDCETEPGFKSLAAKYSIAISYDENNVYVTFYGKNEEFEKPKSLIGKKVPWKRFFQQSSQERGCTPSGSRSFDDLIAQLEAVDPTGLEFSSEAEGVEAFDELVSRLAERGIKLRKPLCDAIKYFGFHNWMPKEPAKALEELIEFLKANREFLGRVYESGKFYRPFEIDFYDVSDAMQRLALRMMMANGVKDPGKYIFVSPETWRTKVVVVLLPVSEEEFHLIAATVHGRRWPSPPSKADEHLRGLSYAIRRVLKMYPPVRKRIRGQTFILIGRYTRGVRGGMKRRGYAPIKQAVLVFRNKRWLQHLKEFLTGLFSKRLSRLQKRLRSSPYGVIKQMCDAFSAFLEALRLTDVRTLVKG